MSPRGKKPLVVLNCAAIPKDLMESEIFGHVKGAFTGAISDHEGAASQADGGTLFLDEVCEMDLHLQSKLLRFIQTGTFTKVGGTKQEKVDIRFICATNRDPLVEIGEGRFREDLYYRLHVIPIHLPRCAPAMATRWRLPARFWSNSRPRKARASATSTRKSRACS